MLSNIICKHDFTDIETTLRKLTRLRHLICVYTNVNTIFISQQYQFNQDTTTYMGTTRSSYDETFNQN